jgi:hypothetical protein
VADCEDLPGQEEILIGWGERDERRRLAVAARRQEAGLAVPLAGLGQIQ